MLHVKICKRCSGEQVWPQPDADYPHNVKVENPCDCKPRNPEIVTDWQTELADRKAEPTTGESK